MRLAKIRAIDCVGCAKCLPACPVDAIMGAPQFLHIVMSDECIGCGLCVAPCPMDCIEMVESPMIDASPAKTALANKARQRYQAKQQRIMAEQAPQLVSTRDPVHQQQLRKEIQEAVDRVNRKHAPMHTASTQRSTPTSTGDS